MVKVFMWTSGDKIPGTIWYQTGWVWQATGLLDEMLIQYKHVKWFYAGDLTFIGMYAGQRYMIQKSFDLETDGWWRK